MDIFEIRYVSLFRYPQPVWDSHNVLRAAPCSDERQVLLSYKLSIMPPSRAVSYTDYFGTRVDLFGVARPHRELEVVAESRVAIHAAQTSGPPEAQRLAARALVHRVTPRVSGAERAHGLCRERAPRGARGDRGARRRRVGAGPARSAAHVARTLQYAPGSTHVGIDVNELQRTRRGVCQDFAHYLIALCRSVGLPARYVSGYLFATRGNQSAAPSRDEVLVQTHAWVEVALPGVGWWPLDPTNRMSVGARHVKIGHGRDYDDVMPLRGLYHGPFQHELEVEVRMKRLTSGAAWASQSQGARGQSQSQRQL